MLAKRREKQLYGGREEGQDWPLSRWWIEMTQNVDRLLMLRWPDTTVTEVIIAQKQSQLNLSNLPNKDGREASCYIFFFILHGSVLAEGLNQS